MEPVKKPNIQSSIKTKKPKKKNTKAVGETNYHTLHQPQKPKQLEDLVPDSIQIEEAGVDDENIDINELIPINEDYIKYIDIIKIFESPYFVQNNLKTNIKIKQDIKQDIVKNEDTENVYNNMKKFLPEICNYLLNQFPLNPNNQYPITDECYNSANKQLEVVEDFPFEQYDIFIDMFKEYYLCVKFENWYAKKIIDGEYLQAVKNIQKENKLTKEFLEYSKFLKLVSENKILSDSDLTELIDTEDIEERVDSFGREKELKDKYDNMFVVKKEHIKEIIEGSLKKYKETPLIAIEKFDERFNIHITNYKVYKNLTNTVFKSAENIEKKLEDKHTKLKEKVKAVYVDKLNNAIKEPDYLDLKAEKINEISDYYVIHIISPDKLDTQIKEGVEKQYSPPKQVWLKNILNFTDADSTAKNTTGDNCADLTSTANKGTHSTLYRKNVPDNVNVKEKSKEYICNLVLGVDQFKCFHVSTTSFTILMKSIAAHSYRSGAECLYYREIGNNFEPLTEKKLSNELKKIKDNQVAAKEALLSNAIDKHFHGYQKLIDTVFVK